MRDILEHYLMNFNSNVHLSQILSLLIISIFVLVPVTARWALSIHIAILSLLQKNLEGWLSKPRSLSYLPPRPLVLVIVAVTLTLLTLLNPLVSLLLLILCLPLFQPKSWRDWGR